MQSIRPSSDLQNEFTEISRDVHDGSEPVIPIRVSSAGTVAMTMETFRPFEFDREVYRKLKEAERQTIETHTRYTSEEVLASVRQIIATA